MIQSLEIAPGVHRIMSIFFDTRVVACHLLIGAERSLLVDTGMSHTPKKDLFPYFEKIGFDPDKLDYVLVTHSDIDHQCGNDVVKARAPNARFIAHNLDKPLIESPRELFFTRAYQFTEAHGIGPKAEAVQDTVDGCGCNVLMDYGIEGGETPRLGPDWAVELVHTPGHSWGHTGVYDPKNKLFIAAESALWNAILDKEGQPAMPPTYYYVDAYLATLARLRSMDIAIYSPAHWPIQHGNEVGVFLDESRNYVMRVEALLLEVVRAAREPITLRQLIADLKPRVGEWPADQDENLAPPFTGSLRRLEDRGYVEQVRGIDGFVAWREVK